MVDKDKQPWQSEARRRDGGVTLEGQKRFKLIACEIVYRELCKLVAETPHRVDVTFLRKGLHDAGREKMRQTIQEAVDAVDGGDYDAVLLGYGRCNDGVVGLRASGLPLVLPRAHDCITFFFGSNRAYQEYFQGCPGTYFRTTGWTERGAADDDSVMAQLGLNQSYQEYVDKYGEENARFIMESMGSWTEHYRAIAYINMGLSLDEAYGRLAKEEARDKGLSFKSLDGDWRMLQGLIGGNWDEGDFLVVPPGWRVAADDGGAILRAAAPEGAKG